MVFTRFARKLYSIHVTLACTIKIVAKDYKVTLLYI